MPFKNESDIFNIQTTAKTLPSETFTREDASRRKVLF